MVKKLIAALTALTMCAAISGCGKSAESDASSSSAAETSAAASSAAAEDSSETEGENSSEAATESSDESSSGTDDSQGSGEGGDSSKGNTPSDETTPVQYIDDFGVGTKLVNNIIYFDGSDMYDTTMKGEPTDAELAKIIKVALAQYKAAQKQDMKVFLDSFNLDITREPMINMTYQAYDVDIGDEFDKLIEGQEVRYEVLDDIADLLMDIGDQDIMEEIYDTENPDLEEIRRLVNALYDSISPDKDDMDDDLYYYTIWGDDLAVMREESDTTTYAIILYYYEKHDGEMYCKFDMMVLDGGFEYYMDDVDVWCIDGKYGVYAGSAGYFEEDELKGKTAQEIYDEMLEEITQYDTMM